MVLIAHARSHSLNVHARLSIGTIGKLLRLPLHLFPYFGYASNEGYSETVETCSLARAFAATPMHMYQHPICLLIYMYTRSVYFTALRILLLRFTEMHCSCDTGPKCMLLGCYQNGISNRLLSKITLMKS